MQEDFLHHHGLELIVQNLQRFALNPATSDSSNADDALEQDSQGIFHTFTIIENLSEIDEEYLLTLCKSTDILTYLSKYVLQPTFDSNKQYACEILSILLQAHGQIRKAFMSLKLAEPRQCDNGVEILLHAIAMYRKKDPQHLDEYVSATFTVELTR